MLFDSKYFIRWRKYFWIVSDPFFTFIMETMTTTTMMMTPERTNIFYVLHFSVCIANLIYSNFLAGDDDFFSHFLATTAMTFAWKFTLALLIVNVQSYFLKTAQWEIPKQCDQFGNFSAVYFLFCKMMCLLWQVLEHYLANFYCC